VDQNYVDERNMDLIQKDAAFYVNQFIKDLCSLGTVFEFYFALRRVKYYGVNGHLRILIFGHENSPCELK